MKKNCVTFKFTKSWSKRQRMLLRMVGEYGPRSLVNNVRLAETFWLVVLGFNATLTARVMAVGDGHVFPGFLTPVLTLLSFQSHRLLFSHAFSRGERRKYAGKKARLNQGLEFTTTSPTLLSYSGGG